jgi:hypothetical protein
MNLSNLLANEIASNCTHWGEDERETVLKYEVFKDVKSPFNPLHLVVISAIGRVWLDIRTGCVTLEINDDAADICSPNDEPISSDWSVGEIEKELNKLLF